MYFVICYSLQCCIIYLLCLYGALLHGNRGAAEIRDLSKTKFNNFATSRTRSKINKEAKLQCKTNTIMVLLPVLTDPVEASCNTQKDQSSLQEQLELDLNIYPKVFQK